MIELNGYYIGIVSICYICLFGPPTTCCRLRMRGPGLAEGAARVAGRSLAVVEAADGLHREVCARGGLRTQPGHVEGTGVGMGFE